MKSIISRTTRAIRHMPATLQRYGWKKVSVGAILLLAVVFGIGKMFGTVVAPAEETAATRTVTVKSVAELSSDQPVLALVGVVQSKSEATVRAEKSGQVISLNRQLGDRVSAGAVVATIENASESASVLSAQGSVDA